MADFEDKLRDELADNLGLLEPGLQLVEKEFLLRNPHGARGFVDILARDVYGHFVIIEIKRSDASARTALHELHKYVALFRVTHGLTPDKIRCILASTDWHELIVPFSEYTRVAAHPTEGRRIILSGDSIERLESVAILPEASELRLCPRHMIVFVYERRTALNAALKAVMANLDRLDVKDQVIALLHQPSSPLGLPIWAIYVAVRAFQEALVDSLKRKNISNPEELAELEPGSESFKWYWEDCVLGEVYSGVAYDTVEIGYPEKFMQMYNDWQLEKIVRSGALSSSAVWSDQMLIDELRGVTENNNIFYATIASSRFSASWRSKSEAAKPALSFNDIWESAFFHIVNEVERSPSGTMASYIFNPMNIVLILYGLRTGRSPRICPHLEIIYGEDNDDRVHLCHGFVEWDESTYPSDPKSIICQAIAEQQQCDLGDGINSDADPPDLFMDFLMRVQFSDFFELEPWLMRAHGLRYSTRTISVNRGETVNFPPYLGLQEFVAANTAYLDALVAEIEPYVRV